MDEPRCPECDIELDCTTDRWRCPQCGETPRPEQYVHSPAPDYVYDAKSMRDTATEVANLLIEIVQEKPELRAMLIEAYQLAKEIAERNDRD